MHRITKITLHMLVFVCGFLCEDDDELPHVEMEVLSLGNTTTSSDNISELSGGHTNNSENNNNNNTIAEENQFSVADSENDLSWLDNAIKDVAYYLRSYKFNEYDRRYHVSGSPKNGSYFAAYPRPPLRSLHWEVRKYCELSFLHCMEYLNKKVQRTGLKRVDDTTYAVMEQGWSSDLHSKQIAAVEKDCQKMKQTDDIRADPFEGPLERFQWRTTASYYMCWYTMNGVPNLEHFGEACDNHANCLDPQFGVNNHDPRASDERSYLCALYSFCPDPCCPFGHIPNTSVCWENERNPCFSVNGPGHRRCAFERARNTDFTDIVLNRWNVTCQCPVAGYAWESKYGMCVDVNECANKKDACNKDSEICVNLPGSFKCACNWGYVWEGKAEKCVESKGLIELKKVRKSKTVVANKSQYIKSLAKRIWKAVFIKSLSHKSYPIFLIVIAYSFIYINDFWLKICFLY